MSKNIWDIDAEIRMKLLHGVCFNSRCAAISIEPDVAWIVVDSKTVEAIYIKNFVKLKVTARLSEGGVEIIDVTLSTLFNHL
jgi:hypothetical protein